MEKRVIGVCYGAITEADQIRIKERCEALGFEPKFLSDGDFTVKIPEGWLEDCEVVFGNVPVPRLSEATSLQWLQTAAAGVAQYCKPGALSESVMLTNASGGYGVGISEYMVAQMMALLKRFPEYMDNQREHIWRRQGMVGAVTGLNVTVVGLGDIGGAFAKRAHLLGAKVSGVRRHKGDTPDYIEKMYTIDELDEALKDAELVALALPGVADTAGLLNRERIFNLRQGCYIINVGRGDVLDETALAEALNRGHLGGAGLDVFVEEPLPKEHALWDAKNTILTPHVSGGTTFALTITAIVDLFLENLDAYAGGRPFARAVDRKLGY